MAEATLCSVLTALPQREVGGLTASDRFDYQKNWTLCQLLSLHRSGSDYAVLCEFHEDVTILNGSINPNAAIFFQIKTASVRWTVTKLLKVPPAKDASQPQYSILGKLCHNEPHLCAHKPEYRFVSNSGFSFEPTKEKWSSLDRFSASSLDTKVAESILGPLRSQIGHPAPCSLGDRLSFQVSDLPLEGHPLTTTGQLVQFLEERYGSSNVTVGALYRSLFDEIKRRTVAKVHESQPLAFICEHKGITRDAFERMLKAAHEEKSIEDENWQDTRIRLANQGTSPQETSALQLAYRDYRIRSLDSRDTKFQDVSKLLKKHARGVFQPSDILSEFAKKAVQTFPNQASLSASQINGILGQVIALVGIYETNEDELQAASPQSPEGTV